MPTIELKSFAENVNISQQEIDNLLLQKKELKIIINLKLIMNQSLKKKKLIIYSVVAMLQKNKMIELFV